MLFIERGYIATTMPAIAKQAGIALDTVYAAVGKKPTLFRLLVEGAISGVDQPVAAEQRDYVRAIRAEPGAAGKLRIYAKALCGIHPRLAPMLRDCKGRLRWTPISRRSGRRFHRAARQTCGRWRRTC